MAFTIQKHTVRSKWKRNLNDTTINRKKIQKQSLPMLSQTLQKLSTKIKIFIRDFFFFLIKTNGKEKRPESPHFSSQPLTNTIKWKTKIKTSSTMEIQNNVVPFTID